MHFRKPIFLLSCIVCLFLSSSAFALQWGDFSYEVSASDNVTITGYAGAGGAVVIPDTIDGKPVVCIGNSAFRYALNAPPCYGCSQITSVTIPDSVTSIGNFAFAHCSSLTDVTIPDSVISIGGSTFNGCSSLTSVIIPASITSIGDDAFAGCTSLASVTIPSSVTSIGIRAFGGCTELMSIDVESGNPAYSSQDGVMYNKDKTMLIVCPCGKSGDFIIPGSVTSIGDEAFEFCTGLTNITIPSGVISIPQSAFHGCTGLTTIDVDVSNLTYSSQDGVVYNKDKTVLIVCPCGRSGAFIIPDSVTSIENFAVFACAGLTSISIPASVTSIGDSAFSFCFGLISAYFYGNAPTMGSGVFDNCADGFTVYYLIGSTGFTNPWYGYPTKMFFTIKNCPSEIVLGEGNPHLANLRAFRDNILVRSLMGRKIIKFYYYNADSINAALETRPALKVFTRSVLETIAPMVGNN